MMDLPNIQQVMEFAYELNRQSADEFQDRIRLMMRARTEALRHGEQDVHDVVDQRDPGREAEFSIHGGWLRRRVGAVEFEQSRLLDQERQRLRGILDLDTSYLYENTALTRGLGGNRVALAQQHARVLDGESVRLGGGAVPGVEDQGRGWLGRVLSVVQTFNHYGDLAGLPHIPETAEQLGRFVKERYDVYTGEIREAMQVQALGGWEIHDARKFMTALHEQKSLFPSLSREIAQTVESLARDLPRLGDDKLIAAAQDIRRAAFLLGQSGDQLAKSVGQLSRVTGRGTSDIIGAVMTIRDFAVRGSEQPAADVALQTLYSAFTELAQEGQKYGISIEESVYLVGKFRHQLDRAVLSVQDLIHFATSLRNLDTDKRLFIGHEIASRLRQNPKFKLLANELNQYVKQRDEYGLDRLIEVIATGATDVAQKEFGIGPRELEEMQRELIQGSRVVIEELAAQFSGGDRLAQSYIAEQLFQQLLGMSPGMTLDQKAAFRAFDLKDAKIRQQQDDEDKKRVDALMLEQENVFQRVEAWINTKLLLLTDEIDEYVRTHKTMFSGQGLKTKLDSLKAEARDIQDDAAWAMTTGPKGRAKGRVPEPAEVEDDIVGDARGLGWGAPVSGPVVVTSGFGPRHAPTKGASTNHRAIDIKAAVGVPVYAAGPGVVEFAGWSGGHGNSVWIRHPDGSMTRYNHLSKISVSTGARLRGGEEIGKAGATGTVTGPHLDFQYLDPHGNFVDPRKVPKLGVGGGVAPSKGAGGKSGVKGKQQSSYTIDVRIASAGDDDFSRTVIREGLDGLSRTGDVRSGHG